MGPQPGEHPVGFCYVGLTDEDIQRFLDSDGEDSWALEVRRPGNVWWGAVARAAPPLHASCSSLPRPACSSSLPHAAALRRADCQCAAAWGMAAARARPWLRPPSTVAASSRPTPCCCCAGAPARRGAGWPAQGHAAADHHRLARPARGAQRRCLPPSALPAGLPPHAACFGAGTRALRAPHLHCVFSPPALLSAFPLPPAFRCRAGAPQPLGCGPGLAGRDGAQAVWQLCGGRRAV